MTTNRIMMTDKFDDSIYFKADCACVDNDNCQVRIVLEYYKDTSDIEQTVYFKPRYLSLIDRIKILFTGKLPWSHSFVFDSREQIEDYTQALLDGIEYIDTPPIRLDDKHRK